ncbi:hypothetical protein [Microbacterium sp. 18062]|uniref:hypothetical protein n=1 Tax=Microbacterium sp. 18062 TaxID=2681410 RepID=UPI00135A1ADE|nr:hypothetical protein [Microbacterium sp. 18062]
MSTSTMKNRIGVGVAALLTLALAGCTTVPAPDDAGDEEPTQFVACLKAAGVDAKISDQGYVVVRIASESVDGELSIGSGSDDGAESPLLMMGEADGSSWVAAQSSAYFGDDPDTQDAYAACEREHPDFVQPEYDPEDDPAVREQQERQRAAALEFARCARDEGFAWVADPDAASGAIALPAELTEAEFRAVLTACWSEDDPGLAWSSPADELGFDWQAVLLDVMGGGGSFSVTQGEE